MELPAFFATHPALTHRVTIKSTPRWCEAAVCDVIAPNALYSRWFRSVAVPLVLDMVATSVTEFW